MTLWAAPTWAAGREGFVTSLGRPGGGVVGPAHSSRAGTHAHPLRTGRARDAWACDEIDRNDAGRGPAPSAQLGFAGRLSSAWPQRAESARCTPRYRVRGSAGSPREANDEPVRGSSRRLVATNSSRSPRLLVRASVRPEPNLRGWEGLSAGWRILPCQRPQATRRRVRIGPTWEMRAGWA